MVKVCLQKKKYWKTRSIKESVTNTIYPVLFIGTKLQLVRQLKRMDCLRAGYVTKVMTNMVKPCENESGLKMKPEFLFLDRFPVLQTFVIFFKNHFLHLWHLVIKTISTL